MVMWPQAEECLEPQELEEGRQDSSIVVLEGTQLRCHFYFGTSVLQISIIKSKKKKNDFNIHLDTPHSIACDQGLHFTANGTQQWARAHGIH